MGYEGSSSSFCTSHPFLCFTIWVCKVTPLCCGCRPHLPSHRCTGESPVSVPHLQLHLMLDPPESHTYAPPRQGHLDIPQAIQTQHVSKPSVLTRCSHSVIGTPTRPVDPVTYAKNLGVTPDSSCILTPTFTSHQDLFILPPN